jgi:hypothetical protein
MRIGVWQTDKSKPYVINFGRLDIWQVLCMVVCCGVIAGNGYVFGLQDDVVRFGLMFAFMLFFLRNILLDVALLGSWGFFTAYRFVDFFAGGWLAALFDKWFTGSNGEQITNSTGEQVANSTGEQITGFLILFIAAVPFCIWLVSNFVGKKVPWKYERWLIYSMLGMFIVKLVVSG